MEVSIFVVLEFLSDSKLVDHSHHAFRFNLCCIRISFRLEIILGDGIVIGVSIFVVLEFLSDDDGIIDSLNILHVSIFVVLEFLSDDYHRAYHALGPWFQSLLY